MGLHWENQTSEATTSQVQKVDQNWHLTLFSAYPESFFHEFQSLKVFFDLLCVNVNCFSTPLVDYDVLMCICRVHICVQVRMHMCDHICGGIERYGKYMCRCRGNRCRRWGGVPSSSLHQLNSELEGRVSLASQLALEIRFHLPISGSTTM